jgi:hypothetical protein
MITAQFGKANDHCGGTPRMRLALLALLLPLALAGCLSFSSSDPPPPAHDTTIVVPPGSSVSH